MSRSKLVFIGVSTGGSSIMRVFPRWMEILRLNAEVVGCDLPLRAAPALYRRVLERIVEDPLVTGALITAHKIDLLAACRERFHELDAEARVCDEVSCVIKRDGKLLGAAMDPLASALALDEFVPAGHWSGGERDLLCLGAGGAAIAISVALARASNAPRRFLLTDIAPERLAAIRRVHHRLETPIAFEYHLAKSPADNDALLESLPPGSLVINATGLGKDRPGSPLGIDARFPRDSFVWELNYRGERDFMRQAAAQASERGLTIEDGWNYFLHGWTQVIARVFGIALDRATFAELRAAAGPR